MTFREFAKLIDQGRAFSGTVLGTGGMEATIAIEYDEDETPDISLLVPYEKPRQFTSFDQVESFWWMRYPFDDELANVEITP